MKTIKEILLENNLSAESDDNLGSRIDDIEQAIYECAKEVALAFYKYVEGVLPDNVKPLWDEFEKEL